MIIKIIELRFMSISYLPISTIFYIDILQPENQSDKCFSKVYTSKNAADDRTNLILF